MNELTLKEQRLVQKRNDYFRDLERERENMNQLNNDAKKAFITNPNYKEENRDAHKRCTYEQIQYNIRRFEERADSLFFQISCINQQLSDIDYIRYRMYLLALKDKEIRDFLETPK